MNTIKSFFLLTVLSVVLVIMGRVLGGNSGMAIALVFAFSMNFFSYWFSDKIVLKMYGAREVTRDEAPSLFKMVETLAIRAKLPMPKVYIIDSDTPNAFATGRNPEHSAVAVTTGIVRMLDQDELLGVLGHELAHVKHRDILLQTVAATVAAAITFIANMAQWAMIFSGRSSDDDDSGGLVGGLLMMILAPIAATLLQMAISRSREFVADEGGARISGSPLGLARALEKLSYENQVHPMEDATPSTAHMFIVSPLNGGGMMKLFSTHPPLEERIARLRAMRI